MNDDWFALDHVGPSPVIPVEALANRAGPQPRLVTVEVAARLLGIGRSKAYELIARGELEVVRIDRCTRVPVAAIDDVVERLRTQARSSAASPGAPVRCIPPPEGELATRWPHDPVVCFGTKRWRNA